jgi:hypothetical protein
MSDRVTVEHQRLEDTRTRRTSWRKWGPYLSERQWGTVREDYSAGGDAWNFFTHDHAWSRAYQLFGMLDATALLEAGKGAAFIGGRSRGGATA